MIYLKNTINGVEAEYGSLAFNKEFEAFMQSVEMVALVYDIHTHLLTSDAMLVRLVSHHLDRWKLKDVHIRLFHKSDIDEALVMASKLHNVDLIPINTNRN